MLSQTLDRLIKEDKNLTPAKLARKLGIPKNKITRILNGDVTDPKASTLLQIAQCFNITIDQLLGLDPIMREGEYPDITPSMAIPLIRISNINSTLKPNNWSDWYKWVTNDMSESYYAIELDTNVYSPFFPKDSILIINSDIPLEDGAYIIVNKKIDSFCFLIKKYVIEENKEYLYPIDPKEPIEIYDNLLYNIEGIILEIHRKFKKT